MGSLLKAKIFITFFSISILILIPLIQTNFFHTPEIKRWSELSWADFQGIPLPFSQYDAAISSAIFLEYDSSRRRFHAYAAQNNMRSWVRNDSSAYGLNHEQYHFNITEIHARLLNRFIEEHPDGSEDLFRMHLKIIDEDLKKMQEDYDDESDHSINFDKQRMWEYRIDSLLTLTSGWTTDSLSGAQIYFPQKPTTASGFTEWGVYRSYGLSRYDMRLSMTSFQGYFEEGKTLDTLVEDYAKRSHRHLSTKVFRKNNKPDHALVISEDSAGHKQYALWKYTGDIIYNASAKLPNNIRDTAGYEKIAMSFLNSFTVVNTDSFWRRPDSKQYIPNDPNHVNMKPKACFVRSEVKKWGFSRGPIFFEDGSMFIAFDPVRHPKIAIDHYMISHSENKAMRYYGGSSTPIFYMSKDRIPSSPFWIDFGYFLKEDSTNTCPVAYRESLLIDGFNRKVLHWITE